jgi:ABC-type nitrate/sulfonate/bicarbonate transport system substrate-binding protein
MTYGTYASMVRKLDEPAGLKVEYIKFTAGPPMFAALSRGDLDMASFSVVPVVYALAQGIDIKMFLLTEDYSLGDAFVVRPQSGIKSFKDQQGKRIAITAGTIPHWGFLRSLEAAGVSDKAVTVLDMPPSVSVPAFLKGEIDGTWTWEPWVVKLESEGGVVAGTFKDLQIPALNVLVVRGAFLKERPDAVQKFLGMWQTAINLKLDDEIAQKIGSEVGLDVPLTRKALAKLRRYTFPEQLDNTLMGTTQTKAQSGVYRHLKEFSAFLVNQKRIKEPVADKVLLDAVEPAPLERYLREHKQ